MGYRFVLVHPADCTAGVSERPESAPGVSRLCRLQEAENCLGLVDLCELAVACLRPSGVGIGCSRSPLNVDKRRQYDCAF